MHNWQQQKITRNDWKQVEQNCPFPCHNTENSNIITSNFFKPLYLEDITSNNSENPEVSILTSNPRPNLMPAKNHSRTPNICTIENCLQNYDPPIVVPRNSSYAAGYKSGKKIFVVGDSHMERIKYLDFNNELYSGKAYFRSSGGGNNRQLDHYIIPTLEDGKPVVLLHVGTNNILNNAKDTDQPIILKILD